jgi:NAD(P)H dehydrogenase (quinone)
VVSILLLYDSRGGLTEQLADAIAEGISAVAAECVRRRIEDAVPSDMLAADGMVVGSPNWSGLTGKLKDWFDYSGDLWESGELAGKVGAAFTAG